MSKRLFRLRVWWARLFDIELDKASMRPERGCSEEHSNADGEVMAKFVDKSKVLVANYGDRLYLAHPNVDVSEDAAATVVGVLDGGFTYRLERTHGAWPSVARVRAMIMSKAKKEKAA